MSEEPISAARPPSSGASFARAFASIFSRASKCSGQEKRGNLTELICDAAARGDTQFMGRILGAGGSLNKKNKEGLLPLHVAAIHGQPGSTRCLVRMGANVNAKDENGYNALHHAILNQQVHLIAQLVNLGANVNEKTASGSTALHLAAELPDALNTRRPSSVSSVDSNQSAHLRFGYQFSASQRLSRETSTTSLRQLEISTTSLRQLETSFNDDSYNLCNCIEALVRSGANLEATDKRGDTPLHAAALAGRTRSIETLLSLGASTNTRNPENKTALSILASKEDLNTVASRLLISNGATFSPASPVELERFSWHQRSTS